MYIIIQMAVHAMITITRELAHYQYWNWLRHSAFRHDHRAWHFLREFRTAGAWLNAHLHRVFTRLYG